MLLLILLTYLILNVLFLQPTKDYHKVKQCNCVYCALHDTGFSPKKSHTS